MTLTPKQKQIVDFIKAFTKKQGYPPSNQQIADHFDFSSRGTVSAYVRRLKEQGYLETQEGRRSITVTQTGNMLPLLGKVAAGTPLEHHKNDTFVEVPSNFLKANFDHFVLQVHGDSMIEDAIVDGDYVVIRKQNTAHNGQTVVASIDGESTLKRFYKKKNDKVELRPANSNFESIMVSPSQLQERHFRIEGVLSGVLRPMKLS